jgi:glycosyltransferase involved in cell wall biosynthesis
MTSISKIYLQIKSLIPVSLKIIPSYIFKSPQRVAGYRTIWIEIRGIIGLLFHPLYSILFKPKLKPISICTGLKNRSSNYLNIFLESILKLDHPELIELSVFDCGSDDVAELESEIRKKWKGKLVFSKQKIEFSRSFAFNRAVEQSSNPIIFVSDADMSLPKDLVKRCNQFVFSKNVWFPVCFHLNPNAIEGYAKENGQWYPVGKGMFASEKTDFVKIGMFDESFKQWGGEDWELWLRFYKHGFFPYRNRLKGLFHHYHVSLKPLNFLPFSR